MKEEPKPRRLKRTIKRLLHWGLCAVVIVLVSGGGWWYRIHHQPQPANTQRPLFQGITYRRDVRQHPRQMVIHVVRIDLKAPGLGFLVTPGDPQKRLPLVGRLTTQFLKDCHLQIAVNGDFFYPWHSSHPWDYYPHIGDPVDVEGFACSRGIVYCNDPRKRRFPTLYFTKDNRVSFKPPAEGIYNAISGNRWLVQGGKTLPPYPADLQPRTAVGLDRNREWLTLVLIDGRQPGYSMGSTIEELGEIFVQCGCETAMNLDGGGSAALAVENEMHTPEILNMPIDNHIPGRERPVANHLGIYAARLKPQ